MSLQKVFGKEVIELRSSNDVKGWSAEEILVLRCFYPITGLNCLDYLPGKTEEDLTRAVTRLGLDISVGPLNTRELFVMKIHAFRSNVYKYMFSDLTREDINFCRECIDAFSSRVPTSWTVREVTLLKKYGKKLGRSVHKYVPYRAQSDVISKLVSLGLPASDGSKWTADEIELLTKVYSEQGLSACFPLIDRSSPAIKAKITSLNLTSRVKEGVRNA